MNLTARTCLAAACFWPTLAFADKPMICQTTFGWCEIAADAPGESDGGVCLCDRDGTLIAGSPAAADPAANPLFRLHTVTSDQRSALPGGGVRASRSFAGPGQFPPASFRAYGLVVFKSRASRFDEERHLMFCESYTNALAHTSELDLPLEAQMVTVWPVARDSAADEINLLPAAEACPEAVANYGLVSAQNALAILAAYEGETGPPDLSGRGPFLVAWTPGEGIAVPGTLALFVDLSDVAFPQDAAEQLSLWRERIQGDPELWEGAPSKAALLTTLRRFFDRNGEILEALGSL